MKTGTQIQSPLQEIVSFKFYDFFFQVSAMFGLHAVLIKSYSNRYNTKPSLQEEAAKN